MAGRFYIPPSAWDLSSLSLTGDEARHCSQVMRHRDGDEIIVFNGAGDVARARITAVRKSQVTLASVHAEHLVPPPHRITLAAALIKAERWEWLIEKATELGASEIQPLVTERCVVRLSAEEAARKQEKWHRLMIETCKQCGRAWAPTLHLPRRLEAIAAEVRQHDLALIASLEAASRSIPQVLAAHQAATRVLILIGPEGDFSPAEYEIASKGGFIPVTLGSQVLRAETAALSSLAILGQLLDTPPA